MARRSSRFGARLSAPLAGLKKLAGWGVVAVASYYAVFGGESSIFELRSARAGVLEQQEDLARFWRQLIRWAVVDVDDRIEMELTRNSDGAVSSIDIKTRVATKAFLPQDDASVKFEITGPGDKKSDQFGEPSLEEAGLFSSEFYPSEAGGYRVKALVRDSSGELLGEKESGWALNPAADEFASHVVRDGGSDNDLEENTPTPDQIK